jgi:hypothetical protein
MYLLQRPKYFKSITWMLLQRSIAIKYVNINDNKGQELVVSIAIAADVPARAN